MDKDDITKRQTPPETKEEWAHVWSAVAKAHASWPTSKVIMAIFGNWKVIGLGIIGALLMGGQELLHAWGLWK